MIKKLFALSLVLISICACHKKQAAGMPNPMRPSSAAEIEQTIGVRFAVPDGAADLRYTIIAGKTAQMDFNWHGAECTARIEPCGDIKLRDISGFYYEWKNKKVVRVGYNKAFVQWTEDEKGNMVGICIWHDAAPGIMYSVSMKQLASPETLSELSNAIYIPMQGEN